MGGTTEAQLPRSESGQTCLHWDYMTNTYGLGPVVRNAKHNYCR
uniref:Kringle domain-containing protein n=1 Tax=Anguilla anguilla TaxID=7936 RepID=A0A0E9T063_ANGAN